MNALVVSTMFVAQSRQILISNTICVSWDFCMPRERGPALPCNCQRSRPYCSLRHAVFLEGGDDDR